MLQTVVVSGSKPWDAWCETWCGLVFFLNPKWLGLRCLRQKLKIFCIHKILIDFVVYHSLPGDLTDHKGSVQRSSKDGFRRWEM